MGKEQAQKRRWKTKATKDDPIIIIAGQGDHFFFREAF
jgi:hypothetical protein